MKKEIIAIILVGIVIFGIYLTNRAYKKGFEEGNIIGWNQGVKDLYDEKVIVDENYNVKSISCSTDRFGSVGCETTMWNLNDVINNTKKT